MKYLPVFTIFFCAALFLSCVPVNNAVPCDEDDALSALLDQVDECRLSGDHEKCFRLYAQLSAAYEEKNLTALQKQYQQRMLEEAEAIAGIDKVRGRRLMAETLQQMATAWMVEGQTDSASLRAHQAYRLAPADTVDFRAQTLLLLAQIHLQAEHADSVAHFVHEAENVYERGSPYRPLPYPPCLRTRLAGL